MAQRPILDEATLQQIMCTLVERFGEPIGHAADAGQGVADERGGHPHKGPKMGNRGFGAQEVQGTSAELDEETAASKRRRIMLKSPVQKQVDPRPRCEDCGRVLTRQDYTSYWDDDFPSRGFGNPTPRICLDCAEKPRINEDVSPAEVNSPVCSQCGGMMGIGLDEDTCTQCGTMGGMSESQGGGRHPGHAGSCTCPDCSRPEAEDENTSYLDEGDFSN